VILDKADFEPWLNGAAGAELLRPAAPRALNDTDRSPDPTGRHAAADRIAAPSPDHRR